MIEERHQFASDNVAAICPEAWAALQEANAHYAPSYGEDDWTARVCDRIREIFETDCDVYFVFTGTAANALTLAQVCKSFHSIICHQHSHIQTDECGAPEFFTGGSKLLLVGGADGKIDSDQLKAIADLAQAHQLSFHMDGARFANAIASLNCAPKAITWDVGIDVLCFGGTKNGAGVGELVIFFDKKISREFEYRAKQAGQLGSKMRFLAAQWLGLLTGDTWLRNAQHANRAARSLASRLRKEAGIKSAFPVEANAVFVSMNERLASGLHARGWR
ncbi:MAG: threonine aldolase, partial [Verrucomicrobia bacterium]